MSSPSSRSEYIIAGPNWERTVIAEDWEPIGNSMIAFVRDGKNVATFFGPIYYVVLTRELECTEPSDPSQEEFPQEIVESTPQIQ